MGLCLQGDVDVQIVAARSCLPIGPVFKVTESEGREIKMLQELPEGAPAVILAATAGGRGGAEGGQAVVGGGQQLLAPEPPLVQLERTLGLITAVQGDALKRELLVGLTPLASHNPTPAAGPRSGSTGGAGAGAMPDNFFGQKPIAFDPFTGSITLPVLPPAAAMQFAMRDTATARADLVLASTKLRAAVRRASSSTASPLACLLLGSMERGNKVFRYSSFEAKGVYAQLEEVGAAVRVPVMGLHGAGVFGFVGSEPDHSAPAAMMECDALYAVLGRR